MSKYYNFLIAGDFKSELSESTLNTFCESHYLHNKVSIVLEIQTIAMYRFKPFVPNAPFLYSRFSQFSGLEKGCIGKNGLILTNCSKSSMNTQTAGTGLLDFHKLLLTVLIIRYEKLGSKTKTYYRL